MDGEAEARERILRALHRRTGQNLKRLRALTGLSGEPLKRFIEGVLLEYVHGMYLDQYQCEPYIAPTVTECSPPPPSPAKGGIGTGEIAVPIRLEIPDALFAPPQIPIVEVTIDESILPQIRAINENVEKLQDAGVRVRLVEK